MNQTQRANLHRLFNPRHIAFVGGQDAAIAIGEAKRIGFTGDYWPVNHKRETLAGFACYSSVEQLPEPPDAVFLATPARSAIDILQSLKNMGAGGVVCYSAGFGEAGDAGREAEQQLIEAAGDLALIGPNCYGVINYLNSVALWPFAHGGACPGYGCAVITQSGMLSSDLTMSQRSLPLTHMISIGNQAVLSMEDLIEELCPDDRVRAIGLHIEGLKDVGRFADVAQQALVLGKPIVALKTGSSAIGKQLISSHTGSLSGEDDLYNALFARTGVIRVYSPAQLLETLKYICIAGVPSGPRVAGFTCSGGGATMLADLAERTCLQFPAASKGTAEKLTQLLPPIATVSNPLDYTTPIWGQVELTQPVFEQALADGHDVAVLVQDYPASGLDESKPLYLADAHAFARACKLADVPAAICSTLPENLDIDTREDLINKGVAPMQGISETLEAIAGVWQWQQRRDLIRAAPLKSLFKSQFAKSIRAIDEEQAKKLLLSVGIPIPSGMLCKQASLLEAAQQLGYPLAIKMIHEKLLHKTEVGAVKLNLLSDAELVLAASDMQASVSSCQPDALNDQFLLETMQPPPIAELIVSIRRDEQFGVAMTLGAGGTLAELLDDVVTVLLPTTTKDLTLALSGLKVHRLLAGYRLKPAANMAVLINVLIRLGEFVNTAKPGIVELEINPLFVYENKVCVIDALVHVQNDG
ncbi:MAG: acyl-CoA synthetase (NDP forming) [Granulosicoccus sp.]|jgi:acyl-CoA synthetase (NDP forming)